MPIETWMYVSKIRRIPLVGQLSSNALQFICGLCGHEPSATEWGYSGGSHADSWCRWCNKYMQVPKESIWFRNRQAKIAMELVNNSYKLGE